MVDSLYFQLRLASYHENHRQLDLLTMPHLGIIQLFPYILPSLHLEWIKWMHTTIRMVNHSYSLWDTLNTYSFHSDLSLDKDAPPTWIDKNGNGFWNSHCLSPSNVIASVGGRSSSQIPYFPIPRCWAVQFGKSQSFLGLLLSHRHWMWVLLTNVVPRMELVPSCPFGSSSRPTPLRDSLLPRLPPNSGLTVASNRQTLGKGDSTLAMHVWDTCIDCLDVDGSTARRTPNLACPPKASSFMRDSLVASLCVTSRTLLMQCFVCYISATRSNWPWDVGQPGVHNDELSSHTTGLTLCC